MFGSTTLEQGERVRRTAIYTDRRPTGRNHQRFQSIDFLDKTCTKVSATVLGTVHDSISDAPRLDWRSRERGKREGRAATRDARVVHATKGARKGRIVDVWRKFKRMCEALKRG